MTKRTSVTIASVAIVVGTFVQGCTTSDLTPGTTLCCTDFKVGADLSGADFGVDASIKGEFSAFAQAAGDLSAVAAASLEDVANACKAIAIAGGANTSALDANDTKAPKDRVAAWCQLAKARIDAAFGASAAAKLAVTVDAPKCEASVKAAASCQGGCTADASCDAKATPPTCEGGKLEVSCSGSCSAAAGASVECEGSCSAHCEGACTAQGGVECAGKCEGTCEGGGSAGGTGAQADGTCKGICKGTCSVTPPSVTCTGSCKGGCSGTCKAQAGASVKCDGTCDVKAEPISCKGGTLKASCKVDGKCDANCNASAQAKAECTPPRVDVGFSGTIDAEASVVLEALRLNLPNVFLVFSTRGAAFVKTVLDVGANAQGVVDPGKLGVKGTACLAAIVPVMIQAGVNMQAAFDASTAIVASTGGG